MSHSSDDSVSYKSIPSLDDSKSIGNEEQPHSSGGGMCTRRTLTRAEKKARRMLIKQGSKPLANISRIVMRQGNKLFIIYDREEYKHPKGDIFIVFGVVKFEDLSKRKEQEMEYNKFKAAAALTRASNLTASYSAKPDCDDADDDEIIDDTDVAEKDIELVMSQSGTTRAKAIRALKENDNDIVNAILELTIQFL